MVELHFASGSVKTYVLKVVWEAFSNIHGYNTRTFSFRQKTVRFNAFVDVVESMSYCVHGI